MKILYFDCIGGISGDMILGALLDSGLSLSKLTGEVKKLKLKNIQLKKRAVERCHIRAIKFDVSSKEKTRIGSYNQIVHIIKKSSLSPEVKEQALRIYEALAVAERKVHGVNAKDIEFEQLGDIDSLVDIVGIAIGFHELKINKFFVSDLPRGKFLAPATLELLKGKHFRFVDCEIETITPTAAAVLKALDFKHAGELGDSFIVGSVGYGAGSHNPHETSNVVRAEIGVAKTVCEADRAVVVETNIDDLNPETYEYLMERLFALHGVHDVYFHSIQMKKSRPGVLVSVLCVQEAFDEVCKIIFSETSSLGVRHHFVNRRKLFRKIEKVVTKYGSVRVKLGSLNGDIQSVAPEYEDCHIIAKKTRVPLKIIYEEAKKEGLKRWPYQG
ncbi:nickel pincer cofactor biosynthesis protein LarC [Candidatus Omnitrophota bacterium]